jgi:integrase/recombinase XerD
MSELRRAVEDYLMVRRALGAGLPGHDHLLGDFVAYLEAAGATTVTTELALAWAGLPGESAHPAYLGNRLCAVRGFARHLQAFDPTTEVPPTGLLPFAECRAVPYLYGDDEVKALMEAARSLTPELRAASYETVIGLLRATGMRIGEVIRLDQDDVDFAAGVLVVFESKYGKSREVPLHPSTLDALGTYAALRDELCPNPKASSFFVSRCRTRLGYDAVQKTFSHLVRQAGLKARSARCRPRIHDMRHSFASCQLLEWYRAGPSLTTSSRSAATASAPATPVSRGSDRSSPTRRFAIPSTPRSSPGSWRSQPSAANRKRSPTSTQNSSSHW